MKAFTTHTGIVATLDRANVDTDAIIPKQFLKSIKRTGYGPNAFFDWRYTAAGQLDPDFELNQERFQGRSILVTRNNFGCGSSREHAPWALRDYGFRCIIAPSYADIFYNNCFKNGILPIVLEEGVVEALFQAMYERPGYRLHVDLERQIIEREDGDVISFEVDEFRRQCLLHGHDDIDITLQDADAIRAFEQRWQEQAPWLFGAIAQ